MWGGGGPSEKRRALVWVPPIWLALFAFVQAQKEIFPTRSVLTTVQQGGVPTQKPLDPRP